MVKLKDTTGVVKAVHVPSHIVTLYNGDRVDTGMLTDDEYKQALIRGLESMQALDKLPVKYIVR